MLYGVQAQEPPSPTAAPTLGAVQMDNTTAVENGLSKTSQTVASSALLTASLWFKSYDYLDDPSAQRGLFSMWDFNNYLFLGSSGIVGQWNNSTFTNFFQFGTTNIAGSIGNGWNHLFMSLDTNHAAGAKLKNLLLNGVDVIFAGTTSDSNSAFTVAFNGKHFGVPNSAGNLNGSQNDLMGFADVWIAPGVYLTASDITKFRSADGKAVDLGANGETPTGSSPAYFFHGDASTFGTNLGSGGTVTTVGTLLSVTGPPMA